MDTKSAKLSNLDTKPANLSKLTARGQELAKYRDNHNVKAMLKTIARAEGMEGKPNAGYDLGYGYRKIASLEQHPYFGKETVQINGKRVSTASGSYQFMGHSWAEETKKLGLTDFSPASQDIAAISRMSMRGALDDVAKGQVTANTLTKLSPEWASINVKGKGYYQGQKTAQGEQSDMLAYFKQQQTSLKQDKPPKVASSQQGVLTA